MPSTVDAVNKAIGGDLFGVGSGYWEPVPNGTVEITGAAASTLVFPNLQESDEEYLVVFSIIHGEPGTGRDFIIRPNGLTTDCAGSLQTSGSHATRSTLILTNTLRDTIQGSFTFRTQRNPFGSVTARARTYQCECVLVDEPAASSGVFDQSSSGGWTGTETLTSLEIAAVTTSGTTLQNALGIGTIARLYRRVQGDLIPKSEVSRTVLTSNAQTLSVTGLDGDADGYYEIEGKLILSTSDLNIDMQPNGSTASLFSAYFRDSALNLRSNTIWRLMDGSPFSTYHTFNFKICFWAGRTQNGVAVNRSLVAQGGENYVFDATNHTSIHETTAVWEDVSANLTSFDFVSSIAGGILAGSQVVVRKIVNTTAVQQPDYLIAALSSNQTTNLNANNHIEFDSFSSRGTSISLATGAGQANGLFTLQGGKTYEIWCNIGIQINEGVAQIRWRNDSGDVDLVDDTGQTTGFMFFRDNQPNDNVVHPCQTIIFTPSVDTTIKLDIESETNFTQIYQSTRVYIKELP